MEKHGEITSDGDTCSVAITWAVATRDALPVPLEIAVG